MSVCHHWVFTEMKNNMEKYEGSKSATRQLIRRTTGLFQKLGHSELGYWVF